MYTLASLFSAESLEHLWLGLNGIDPQLALFIVFALLFLAGCGLPLPEDIPLTFTGILLGLPATQDLFGGMTSAVLVVGLVCYASIITGDLIAYWLGKRYGRAITRIPPFKWAVPEHRIRKLNDWFERFGNWTVFFGRMVAGIRFVTFMVAGMTRMPVGKFIFFDSLAALITVPAWIILGFMVGTHFQRIVNWMSTVSTTTWVVLGIAAMVFLVYRFVRKRRVKKRLSDS
jgi:membrane protein DedA with SNARE-associated domain